MPAIFIFANKRERESYVSESDDQNKMAKMANFAMFARTIFSVMDVQMSGSPVLLGARSPR